LREIAIAREESAAQTPSPVLERQPHFAEQSRFSKID
jgi:hypothetical protein